MISCVRGVPNEGRAPSACPARELVPWAHENWTCPMEQGLQGHSWEDIDPPYTLVTTEQASGSLARPFPRTPEGLPGWEAAARFRRPDKPISAA